MKNIATYASNQKVYKIKYADFSYCDDCRISQEIVLLSYEVFMELHMPPHWTKNVPTDPTRRAWRDSKTKQLTNIWKAIINRNDVEIRYLNRQSRMNDIGHITDNEDNEHQGSEKYTTIISVELIN
jgi:hypothetical protein